MRRADRLFRIVQLLRSGRLQTARNLAQKLQVSHRTIYRDVQDLQLSGVPITGEAGVGYTLRRDFDIPPLMFDREEIAALVLARMVQAWGGMQLTEAANRAIRKIEAVLPADLRERIDDVLLYAPGFRVKTEVRSRLDALHTAAQERRVVLIAYAREDGQQSVRRVHPLALYFWGGAWTLAAWCELRHDFRSFRVDRMEHLESLGEVFVSKAGQMLSDFLRHVREELDRRDESQSRN
ncbi:YafY family protein [Alloacidobacterium sp.]|uniref:helix-turn-helix transcriptional regulator n=1 Tax=Alloacidobacterium sp. TaxID=2951999 RepID=UPI002D6D1B5D|nr:YafY family protein [Alloacidobacterium sp.]HYK35732.1 YafY family protein [Alloacidobacterium sp.]